MFPGLLEFIATSAHSRYRPPDGLISSWLQCMARRDGAPSAAGPLGPLSGGRPWLPPVAAAPGREPGLDLECRPEARQEKLRPA